MTTLKRLPNLSLSVVQSVNEVRRTREANSVVGDGARNNNSSTLSESQRSFSDCSSHLKSSKSVLRKIKGAWKALCVGVGTAWSPWPASIFTPQGTRVLGLFFGAKWPATSPRRCGSGRGEGVPVGRRRPSPPVAETKSMIPRPQADSRSAATGSQGCGAEGFFLLLRAKNSPLGAKCTVSAKNKYIISPVGSLGKASQPPAVRSQPRVTD